MGRSLTTHTIKAITNYCCVFNTKQKIATSLGIGIRSHTKIIQLKRVKMTSCLTKVNGWVNLVNYELELERQAY